MDRNSAEQNQNITEYISDANVDQDRQASSLITLRDSTINTASSGPNIGSLANRATNASQQIPQTTDSRNTSKMVLKQSRELTKSPLLLRRPAGSKSFYAIEESQNDLGLSVDSALTRRTEYKQRSSTAATLDRAR